MTEDKSTHKTQVVQCQKYYTTFNPGMQICIINKWDYTPEITNYLVYTLEVKFQLCLHIQRYADRISVYIHHSCVDGLQHTYWIVKTNKSSTKIGIWIPMRVEMTFNTLHYIYVYNYIEVISRSHILYLVAVLPFALEFMHIFNWYSLKDFL